MSIPESYSIYLLLMSNAVLLAAAALAVMRFRQQCRRLEHFWNSPTGAAIADKKSEQARHHLLITMRLERRIRELQQKMNSVASKDRMPDPLVERQLPIENAVRMAKNGATIEDLTKTCGLNIGEARLMKKLHERIAHAARA